MAEEMMTLMFCGDCGCKQAVCACVCRYPLVFLCEEHFDKSHRAPGGFHHFRLPLEAAHYIQSEESHAQCEKWLFGLDKAHKMLRKHCDDFDHFEQRIDAAYQDIIEEFTRFTESVKEKIRDTKKLFAAKVEEAIHETTLHCIEWWTPPEDSLSSLIWDFANDNPVSLKVYQLSVEAKCIDPVLFVNLESRLPTVCGFKIDEEEAKCDSNAELLKAAAEMSELKSANDSLVAKLEQLRLTNATLEASMKTLNKKYADALAALKVAEVNIKALTEEIEKVNLANFQLQHQLAEVNHENKQLPQDASEVQPLSAVLDADAAFREKRKYQASYELLQQRWRVVAENETVRLGLALCEVAVHLGHFQEAKEVLDRAISIALSPDDLRQLQCAKGILHFHRGEIPEVLCVLREITKIGNFAEISPDLYMISILSLKQRDFGSTEEDANYFLDLHKNPPPIEIFLKRAAVVYGRDCEDSEEFFKQVELICQRPSTSIYFSMVIAHAFIREVRQDMKVQQYFSLKGLIAQHFPRSFWYANTLVMLSDSLTVLGDIAAAGAELREATAFLDEHFSAHKLNAFAWSMLAWNCVLARRVEDAKRCCVRARELLQRFDKSEGAIHQHLANLSNIERLA